MKAVIKEFKGVNGTYRLVGYADGFYSFHKVSAGSYVHQIYFGHLPELLSVFALYKRNFFLQ